MTEQELRAEIVRLDAELSRLKREAWDLFATSGWVKTSDELPPVGLRVLVIERFATQASFAENHGYQGHGGPDPKDQIMDWYHYERGGMCENSVPPDYWMAIPPEPR